MALLLSFSLAATLVAVGAVPASAVASTLYVDKGNPGCTDSGSGTSSVPYCSISAAAAAAVAGQTVQVSTGTYSEDVKPARSGSSSSSPIVFKAASGANVTVTGGTNGFTISSRSFVKVVGFSVTSTTGPGILLSSSHDITLSGNHVTFSGQPVSGQTAAGIKLTGTNSSVISGNTTDHNTDSGIYVTSSSGGNQIIGNVSFSNARGYTRAAGGMDVLSAGNTVADNIFHDNEDSGLTVRGNGNNTTILDNVVYHNGDHGIDISTPTGQVIVGNSVYNNVTAGINVEGGATAQIENNISVDNGIGSPRTKGDYRVDAASVAGGTTMDYDMAYLRTSSPMFVWNGSSYDSLAAFRAAVPGQEVHGIQADPKWKNPSAGDLHLTAGSPAIDSADSGAPSQPGTDLDGTARVDDPATTNTGAGPRTYDDRGAYEYQPPADAAPRAQLTVTPSSPQVGQQVSADASASTDTDATPIATYTFDWGDGSPVTGPQAGATAQHTFTSPGTFTVKVTVTDTANLSSSATKQVTVTLDNPPVAHLTLTPNAGGNSMAVSADASASTDTDLTPIATYTFSWGDGSLDTGPQAGATAQHTYASAGTYIVTVTVTDTANQPSNDTKQATVPESPPNAQLSVTPASIQAGQQVSADASASTDTDATPIATYTFDWGDGSPVTGPQAGATAQHTYNSAGTFTVTVTVKDTAGLSAQATQQVTVTSNVQNLVGNPGFETDTSGWAPASAGSITRVAGGHSGSYAVKVANNVSTGGDAMLNDSPDWANPLSPGTYTGSIWVRADTPGSTLKLRFREYNGSSLVGTATTTTVTLTTSWQQVTIVRTVTTGTHMDFNAYISSPPAGTYFYADDASITKA